MDDIEGDADQLASSLLIPLLIIVGLALLALFAYCLFQRLSRATVKVSDSSNATNASSHLRKNIEEVQKAKRRAAHLRKDLEMMMMHH